MRDRTRTRTLQALLLLALSALGAMAAAATIPDPAPALAAHGNAPPTLQQLQAPSIPVLAPALAALTRPCSRDQWLPARPLDTATPEPTPRAALTTNTHPAARTKRHRHGTTRPNTTPANDTTARQTLAATRESKT